MNEATFWWRIYAFRIEENRLMLNKQVREFYPGAPEILMAHVNILNGRKREVTVGEPDGAHVVLTRGETKSENGLHYEITARFPLGDYGLAEFDSIAESLSHSAPVAAALKAIKWEEHGLPSLLSSHRVGPEPERPRPKTFRESYREGMNQAKMENELREKAARDG